MQVVEREVTEVGSPRRDQVLLLGRQRERVVPQLAQAGDALPEPGRRAAQDLVREGAVIVGADQKAQCAGAIELIAGEAPRLSLVFAPEPSPEVREVGPVGKQQPGAKPDGLVPRAPSAGERRQSGARPFARPDGDNPPFSSPKPLVFCAEQSNLPSSTRTSTRSTSTREDEDAHDYDYDGSGVGGGGGGGGGDTS